MTTTFAEGWGPATRHARSCGPAQRCLIGCLLLLFTFSLPGQTYSIEDSFISDCRGQLYDSGGATAAYQANETHTLTICPDGSSGTHVRLFFSSLDLPIGDTLFFYDGRSAHPDSLIADHTRFYSSGAFFVQATGANADGCLTLVFVSDADEQGAGWEALLSCSTACQNIFTELTLADPPIVPADTGFIDACPGQEIRLSAQALYPQNGVFYEQHDSTTIYEWTMGNGDILYGPEVQYRYAESGGYEVQLITTDQQGCRNLNLINQRIRIAPPPHFDTQLSYPICLGDTLSLTASLDPAADPTVLIRPGASGFPVNAIRSDSLALPDGLGGTYQTSVLINDFPDGQILEQAGDLASICLNIEHSYLFDLDILLTCPNGQSVILQATSLRSGDVTHLGEPYEGDDLISTGESGHLPGIGYQYCFESDGDYTWNDYVDTFGPGLLPAGSYASVEPLEQLVGCPLNGEWAIEVADRLPNDNGWIFEWSLNFARQLLPIGATFSPNILSYAWQENPEIDYHSADSIVTYGDKAGDILYHLIASDDFGCQWDTSVVINVLPLTHPDCYECTELIHRPEDRLLCEMSPQTFNIAPDLVLETPVDYTATPNAPVGFADHPPADPLASSIRVGNIVPTTLNDPNQQLISICIDLETDRVGDIELFLRSPSGQILELSTGNGGNGQAYSQTCFTPTATDAIDTAIPPFTGDFMPEGSFDDLIGTPIGGDWHLLVADTDNPNREGVLHSWSISFLSRNEVTYTWSPTTGLSCFDCPNPTATPDTTTTYFISAVDRFGCTDQDTVTVAYINDLPRPEVSCTNTANGEITFSWPPTDGIETYEVRQTHNGVTGDWQGPITDLQWIVTGLQLQDSVRLEVRIYLDDDMPPCPIPVGEASCTYDACLHEAQIEEVTPVLCADSQDGRAMIMGVRGVAPYQYFLDGDALGQTQGVFENLSAGPHLVAVADASGCVDTAFFDVPAPPPLLASIEQEKAVSCPDGNDGILRANVSGGAGRYHYDWVGTSLNDTAFVSGLSPGLYELIVTDTNNCQVSTSLELANPTGMQLSITAFPTSCADTQDGGASVTVSGGIPDYSFAWDSGATIAEPSDLAPGQHCVTVTDARGCSQTNCITIEAPTPLTLDSIQIKGAECFNTSTGGATAFVSGGSPEYTYQWSDELQQISQQAVRLRAGSYQLRVSDQRNCSLTASVQIPEPDSLLSSVEVTDARCFDSNDGIAQVLPVGGSTPFSYNWSHGGTSERDTALAPGEYTITVTDANGCISVAETVVGRPASPVSVQAEQIQRGCAGMMMNEAEAIAVGGTGEVYTYRWNDLNQQQQSVAQGLDAATYVVTATDQLGCTGVDTLIISDLPPVMIGIIANAPSCSNTADGRMGVNQISGGIGGEDPDNFTFRWSTGDMGLTINGLPGNQEYAVTATDAQGCSGVQMRFIPQPDTIAYDLELSHVSCHSGNDGEATIADIQGPGSSYSVQWDARSGAASGRTASNLRAGTYGMTITDDQGCLSRNTIFIDEPDPLQISFSTEDNACFGDRVGSITTQVSGGTPDYTYTWDRGLPPQRIVDGLAAGAYVLTVTDDLGCTAEAGVEIKEPTDVSVEMNITDVSCFGARDGRIQITTEGGTPPFLFSRDNQAYNGISTLIGLPAGPHTVYVKDGGGCQYVSTIEIGSPPEFRLDLGEDMTIELGDTVNLYVDIIDAVGEVDLFWSAPYDGTLSCEQCDGPAIWPQYRTTYTVTGYDENGCLAEDQITVTVEKPRAVMVPTGFTPNADGRNDRLQVHGREGTQVKVFRVFDRWGELLYERFDFPVNDPDWGWDGTFRGQPVIGGVYLWYLEVVYQFDGEEAAFRGQTTLIR